MDYASKQLLNNANNINLYKCRSYINNYNTKIKLLKIISLQ